MTCEVNAHHLTWAEEDVPVGGTLYKCMPPLRDRANLEALWDGLQVRSAARPLDSSPFTSIVCESQWRARGCDIANVTCCPSSWHR